MNEVITVNKTQLTECTTKKRRSKGERTREKILISAIEILAFNGLKGTTHRAIANHADLQLSLTTYYFKDIQELIHQAFKLNSDRILSRSSEILDAAFTIITKVDKKDLKRVATKKQLCEQLSEITSNHLIDNIKNHAISLAVERLMITEVQISPELRFLSQEHELAQLVPYEHLCSFFNKTSPKIDAKIMYSVFSQLQYEQLANQVNIDCDLIKQTTHRIISWVLSLK